MTDDIILRHETPADHAAIHDLTAKAFAPMPFCDGTEADALDILRRDGQLALSLVAERAGQVVGQATFSPAWIENSDGDWFCLGPISVAKPFQRQGIGSRLSAEGLRQLALQRASGVVLMGNPSVYVPMGYRCDNGLSHGDIPRKYIHYQRFKGATPSGEVRFAGPLQEA